MATIELYARRVNLMSDKFNSMKNYVNDFKNANESIRNQSFMIDTGICNTEVMQNNIQATIDKQQAELDSMDSLIAQTDEFYDLVISTDESVAEAINQSKNDFYEEYSYLKPDEEKSGWEKFCDGLETVGEWCKEHWKLVVTIVLVIAAVVVVILSAGTAAALITPLLLLAAKGVLVGAVVGGILGGTMSAAFGGSFFEGFENGAFGGAISGLISCGLGALFSGGSQAALSIGKTILVGALSETGTSLISDLGDIIIKGDSISFGQIIFNAGISCALSIIGTFGSSKLSSFKRIKIPGINKGRGSWSYIYHYQIARSMRDGVKLGLEPLLKGCGASIVTDMWDYIVEVPTNALGEWIQVLNEK